MLPSKDTTPIALANISEARDYFERLLFLAKTPIEPKSGLHLAIFCEPYLTALLEGRKTLESRFMERQIAPYKRVWPGDWVVVKKSSGPVMAYFQVRQARHLQLDAIAWNTVHAEMGPLQVSEEFLESKKDKNFVTLVGVSKLHILEKAVTLNKKGQQSWVILRDEIG